jgi:hypothetical protein
MADLLDGIREQLKTRLSELRPLVEEHDRLETALRALGEGDGTASRGRATSSTASAAGRPRTAAKATADNARTTSSAAPTAARRRGAAKAKPSKPRTRAVPGANREAVLRAVRERPGASSAQLAVASGVERNTLYGLLGRLVKAGELEKVKLPTGTGYAPRSKQRGASAHGAASEGTANAPTAPSDDAAA